MGKKYINIGGEDFEVIKSKYTDEMFNSLCAGKRGKDLYYYYENPSSVKRAIYDYWLKWYSFNPDLSHFEVTSANTFTFTIECILRSRFGEIIGIIQITKAHNRLYVFK